MMKKYNSINNRNKDSKNIRYNINDNETENDSEKESEKAENSNRTK